MMPGYVLGNFLSILIAMERIFIAVCQWNNLFGITIQPVSYQKRDKNFRRN